MKIIENVTFNELRLGDTHSWFRVAADYDIRLGALYSGDHNPVHLSDEYAAKSQFGNRIVHGLWLEGAVSGILGIELPGLGTILLNKTVSYRAPVYIGDAVIISLTCISKRADKPWATFAILVTNQHGKTVLTGEAEVLCPTEKQTFPRQVPGVKVVEHDEAELPDFVRAFA